MLPANLPDAVDEFLAAAQLDGNRVIARITPNRAGTPPRQDLILASPLVHCSFHRADDASTCMPTFHDHHQMWSRLGLTCPARCASW